MGCLLFYEGKWSMTAQGFSITFGTFYACHFPLQRMVSSVTIEASTWKWFSTQLLLPCHMWKNTAYTADVSIKEWFFDSHPHTAKHVQTFNCNITVHALRFKIPSWFLIGLYDVIFKTNTDISMKRIWSTPKCHMLSNCKDTTLWMFKQSQPGNYTFLSTHPRTQGSPCLLCTHATSISLIFQ